MKYYVVNYHFVNQEMRSFMIAASNPTDAFNTANPENRIATFTDGESMVCINLDNVLFFEIDYDGADN